MQYIGPMPSAGNLALTKRAYLREARLFLRHVLGSIGVFLPFSVKLWLAKRSSKLGMLLMHHGPFVLDGYLGQYRIKLDVRSSSDRAVVAGRYEPETLETIKRVVKAGDTCLDIGANTGVIALALCKQVGQAGKVYAFEPGPPFFQRLQENRSLNSGLESRLVLVPQGLSDRPGELHWREDPEFPGNAFLFGVAGQVVPVTTLDSYFSDLARLDFIKIDVEGMEGDVLRGGETLLRRFHPTILFESTLEFEAYRSRPVRRELANFLVSLGYSLFSVDNPARPRPAIYPRFGNNTLAVARVSSEFKKNRTVHL